MSTCHSAGILLFGAVFALSACGGEAGQQTPAPADDTATAQPEPAPAPASPPDPQPDLA